MKFGVSDKSRIVFASLFVGVLTMISAPGAVARADDSAMSAVQSMVNQAVKILADQATPQATRASQLRDLIAPSFDFAAMSRSALGYHWKSLNPAQRADFTQTFTGFIEAAYGSKIGDYHGQQVNFIKQTSLGNGYFQVFSQIVQPGGKAPVPVNYLVEQKDGQWKVYDVTVDDISIIANYRTQFNRVINENGFDKLLADLKAKQQQLNQTKSG
ncbi:MAG TPA: ABC transporter substrate-binding protein [Candidatus Binataceae bacterium]|nr:ABC transporter substrate-binding protein [Candidatus Binataceae bacterium]